MESYYIVFVQNEQTIFEKVGDMAKLVYAEVVKSAADGVHEGSNPSITTRTLKVIISVTSIFYMNILRYFNLFNTEVNCSSNCPNWKSSEVVKRGRL